MRQLNFIGGICSLLLVCSAAVAATRAPCDDGLTQRIPPRSPDALTGQQFAARIEGVDGEEREALIEQQLLQGNLPAFLRHLWPVQVDVPRADGAHGQLVLCAEPDYLAIGSDEDFLLIPLRLGTALAAASRFGLTLPTPRMVDAIYAQASVHFAPQPLPAGDQMRSTRYYRWHDQLVEAQRSELGAVPGVLSAGHKKDLVLTARLWRQLDRVAIYGWHLLDGSPIQPLSTVHGWRYVDYSHGARLISDRVFLDGNPRSLWDVLSNLELASALSTEGAMPNAPQLLATLMSGATASPASYRRLSD